EGDTSLAAADTVRGDLAVLDGSLSLQGVVTGDVLVVNGNAMLDRGATIAGSLLVIGGRTDTDASARVGGEIATYSASLPYERAAGRVRLVRGPQGTQNPFDRRGHSDFLITTGKSYNRVEGMPI